MTRVREEIELGRISRGGFSIAWTGLFLFIPGVFPSIPVCSRCVPSYSRHSRLFPAIPDVFLPVTGFPVISATNKATSEAANGATITEGTDERQQNTFSFVLEICAFRIYPLFLAIPGYPGHSRCVPGFSLCVPGRSRLLIAGDAIATAHSAGPAIRDVSCMLHAVEMGFLGRCNCWLTGGCLARKFLFCAVV